ncbi:membrane protein DedA, SNARE-associated domain [Halogeometricum rufum]|uniref:Membrane protein DedA, SNARE-associated domain n=1 Tax=Halogeometricum rufum TaxID=553469 RepID=A0A1I6J552_9EURY|nr:VTT domain-containing protein [Halogeometricum rufum]SFR74145.1 membrane protein DedA, SNARE-associated domain [Halogeometricum rufum]
MSLTQPLLDALVRYGYLGIFVFTFLETSLLFPLLPSELVVPAIAGVAVGSATGAVAFAAAGAAGGTVGGLFAYRVFGARGATAAERYGDSVRVSQDDIDRGRRLFSRWGEHSVLWGRLLPFFRSAVSIPAGFAQMSLAKFAVYTAAGTFAFDIAVAGLVLYGRRQVERVGARHLATRLVALLNEFVAARPAVAAVVGAAAVFLAAVAVGLGVSRWAPAN